jgi:Domain of Unknown Function (DUF1080)
MLEAHIDHNRRQHMNRSTLIRATALAVTAGALALSGCATPPAADAGWVTLIDGTNGMDNFFAVGDAQWQATDGAVQAERKTGPANGFLMTKKSYTDFQIRAEFWASDNANSGIFMRCQNVFDVGDRTCYEANIFDQRPDPKYATGAVVNFAAITQVPKAGGKWNTYDVTVKGKRITLVLNGATTVDFEDASFASGPIGLQYAAGTIKFRKVQVRAL